MRMVELQELLDEANRDRESIPELAGTDEFTDRTIYYYSQQGLLPRASRKRGPGAKYPADFVDRLLFIRRLQKEQSLTLTNIREVMSKVDPKTIRRVARGHEPLEIRVATGYEPEDLKVHSQVMPLRSSLGPHVRELDEAPYMHRTGTGPDKPAARNKPSKAESRLVSRVSHRSYAVGADADLTIRRSLSPLQETRVEQVVALLKSILDDED
jgi:DNA-binding transcriptional MerR regulator